MTYLPDILIQMDFQMCLLIIVWVSNFVPEVALVAASVSQRLMDPQPLGPGQDSSHSDGLLPLYICTAITIHCTIVQPSLSSLQLYSHHCPMYSCTAITIYGTTVQPSLSTVHYTAITCQYTYLQPSLSTVHCTAIPIQCTYVQPSLSTVHCTAITI